MDEKRKAYDVEYYQKNKTKHSLASRKRRYGIAPEEQLAIL